MTKLSFTVLQKTSEESRRIKITLTEQAARIAFRNYEKQGKKPKWIHENNSKDS